MLVFEEFELGPLQFASVGLGGSLVAGIVCYLLARPARRIGLVSRSRRDRFGSGGIPLTGGLGLAAGMAAVLAALRPTLDAGWLTLAAGLFLVGLYDDLRHPRPAVKLGLQVLVTVAGLALGGVSWAYAGMAIVTILVLVNAANYLDNMDGVLAGVALTQALAMLLFPLPVARSAALLVWTLPAILLLTLPPARLYLGDSGSHLIGALLALEALQILLGDDGVRSRFVPPLALVFAIPLADVAVVTVSRLRRKRPILRGGTDHLSHRLVRVGWTVPRAVLILVLASGVCGIASLLLVYS
jgi:UDP-GlcNAc:undecaprenyl-phosphate GlcNAc-1-phosphate transferase